MKRRERAKQTQRFLGAASGTYMVMRSTPKPQPPVGGKAWSSATQKSSSTGMASSSPPFLAAICSWNRAR